MCRDQRFHFVNKFKNYQLWSLYRLVLCNDRIVEQKLPQHTIEHQKKITHSNFWTESQERYSQIY